MSQNLNKNIISIVLIASFFIFLNSCSHGFIFEETQKVSDNIWNSDEKIEISLPITDISKSYNIYILFENQDDYSVSNLWLNTSVVSPEGKIQSELLNFEITDNTGKWLGEKSGETIKNIFLYKQNIKFPTKGTYKFIIKQQMREKETPKNVSVGIALDFCNKEEIKDGEK